MTDELDGDQLDHLEERYITWRQVRSQTSQLETVQDAEEMAMAAFIHGLICAGQLPRASRLAEKWHVYG